MLRPHLHHVLTRALAALVAIAACWLAAPVLGSARADDAQVTVTAPGGNEQTLSLAALAGSEDVVERTYGLSSATGDSATVVTGFSIAALIEAAGADPFGFSYLEVQRPAGGSVLLSRDQALDPGAFADGPPVVYATAGGTGFLRPSSGPGDTNASDSFVAPQGVTIVLRKGSPLLVEIESSTTRTRPGKAVSFEAIVERAGSGEQLSYSWHFDDGHSATGASASHAFEKRGSYDVIVGVTTPGDRAGASAVVTIQVGAPLAGPDRKGGGRVDDAAAPDHGVAGPPTADPSGSSVGVAPRDAQRDHRPRVRLGNADAALRDTAGEPVVGRLVSATVPADRAEPVAAARTGKLSSDAGGGVGLSDAALGVLITAGLLGAGAIFEVRSVPR